MSVHPLRTTWEKRGLVYRPNGRFDWNKSHAQLPIADLSREDRWRIYFASRDSSNRARIGYVEVEPGRPERILYEHHESVLPLGPLGSFDESGVMPVALVNEGGLHYLFYAGWSLSRAVPYHNSIGLAVSGDGGASFQKIGAGPIFDRLPHEPYFTGTIAVLVEEGVWRGWYQSCTEWRLLDDAPEPFYNIKYAQSTNGVNWSRSGVVAIDYKDEQEGGISSASVIRDGDGYRMWHSHRGKNGYREPGPAAYRVGYAESSDGLVWKRDDALAGIDVSSSGWDSEMIAYPNVVRYGGELFMFYNGNGFGRSGFGYAVAPVR